MAWECADCRRQQMIAVCHHCGKPVCGTDSVVIADDAFDTGDPPSGRAAVHCRGCKGTYHSRAQDIERERAGATGAASP
jgi:hypothetical protein